MKLRYPDKPKHIYTLRLVKESEWFAQPKLDGHNALIMKEAGKTIVLSRHMNTLKITQAMQKACEALPIENGTVLNAEWTKLRKAWKEEGMWLFDILYEKGQWVGGLPAEERYAKVAEIQKGTPPTIHLIEVVETGFADLYRRIIGDMKTEGIVLKRRGSKIIGDRQESVENPNIYKLKWRDGADGLTRVIVPDDDLICAEE